MARIELESALDQLGVAYLADLAAIAVYETTTAGLSATAEGGYFQVPVTENSVRQLVLYRKVSGAASEVLRQASGDIVLPMYSRSGYTHALTDALNNVALGVRKNGEVDIGSLSNIVSIIEALQAAVADIPDVSGLQGAITALQGMLYAYTERSGVKWGVVDEALNLPLYVDRRGELWTKDINVTALLQGMSSDTTAIWSAINALSASLSAALTPVADIWCLGDSLTEGAGSTAGSGNYPYRLSQLYSAAGLARSVNNAGIGGQVSEQIAARMGANPVLVTLSGNQIPASGAVAVTAITTALLSTPATTAARTIKGWIEGVYGTLSKDSSNAYSFTRDTDGAAVPVTAEVVFKPDVSGRDSRTAIIWSGRNDGTTDAAKTKAHIAQMVAALKPLQKRFVVMSILNSTGEEIGTANYTFREALNRDLKLLYPDNYLDIKAVLMRNGNGGADDNADIANGLVPRSLRSDGIHLNDAGYQIVANAVKAFLDQKGW